MADTRCLIIVTVCIDPGGVPAGLLHSAGFTLGLRKRNVFGCATVGLADGWVL